MPFDSEEADAKVRAVNKAFAAIGATGAAKAPESRVAGEPAAWELHLAAHLERAAKARKVRAHADAIAAGVIFDHEKAPLAVGTNRLVFAGEVVEVSVAVSPSGSTTDLRGLLADLEASGVKPALLARLAKKHTRDNRPAHRFASSLVVLG